MYYYSKNNLNHFDTPSYDAVGSECTNDEITPHNTNSIHKQTFIKTRTRGVADNNKFSKKAKFRTTTREEGDISITLTKQTSPPPNVMNTIESNGHLDIPPKQGRARNARKSDAKINHSVQPFDCAIHKARYNSAVIFCISLKSPGCCINCCIKISA